MWLSDADLDRVQKIVAQNRPVTDEESREITTMQLRNLLEAQRPTQPPPKIPRRFYLFALPTLVVFVCGIFLVRTYPSAVFLWGDEVERNNNLIQRRRVLWGVIIGIMVIGVFSKLLYEGIASWVPGS